MSTPFLSSTVHYTVHSVSGDNYNLDKKRQLEGSTTIFESEAFALAERLAKANPGTRYYVQATVGGFFVPPPAEQNLQKFRVST